MPTSMQRPDLWDVLLQQQKLAQYETRKVNYNHTWKTDLTHAVLTDPLCEPGPPVTCSWRG